MEWTSRLSVRPVHSKMRACWAITQSRIIGLQISPTCRQREQLLKTFNQEVTYRFLKQIQWALFKYIIFALLLYSNWSQVRPETPENLIDELPTSSNYMYQTKLQIIL